jgi:S1-C subfamily serine protease/tetratricopeptide (TPR) repeat protein
MKLCQNCEQPLAEEITICPSCGSEVGAGRRFIDDYRIEEVLHEGHASFLCKAIRERTNERVMIRLFTKESGVDERVAERLKREIEELKKLPVEGFVRHYSIRRSTDGLWYRISEWVDAVSWGDLVASGRLNDYGVAFNLFYKIASILEILHLQGYFIPHLILDDIIVVENDKGELDVKIDYKLSRFFDPKLDRPGPMLKRLLTCHPDIINARPLDFRSDIWSLGKIFVELLTADYETPNFLAKIDELLLPHEAKFLFKSMLADDPDLRPRSMNEVVDVLGRIKEGEIEEAKERQLELTSDSARAIRAIKKRLSLLAVLVALLVVAAALAWFRLDVGKKDSSAVLEGYANQYARSVAFVLIEYWLEEGKEILYRNRAEGTAFLVDSEGYLLTNRHVACPWLQDISLTMTIDQLRENARPVNFKYRTFLWFEGEKAFNLSAGLMESPDLADSYFLGSAFRTDGTPGMRIAGVAKAPVQTRYLITSPLKNDFAVLKIDQVPEGLKPLPLDVNMDAQSIPKLSRVISLGFPLGSRTQADTVNVSVARGHVRRCFENLIQVDAPIYGGESGGPVIDMRGKVIGIVSGVAKEWTHGLLPVATPLWNMAMVLPITKAVTFLQDLKVGQVKWNGVLDLSVEEKLKRITETAAKGCWAEAMDMADKELKLSLDPQLVMATGMMYFCAGDNKGATRLLERSLSIEPENSFAKLMIFLIDWLAGDSSLSRYRDELLALDWRSPAEFIGYLVRVFEGRVDEESALKGWYNESERSWLNYVIALIKGRQGEWAESERLLKEALLSADTESWEFFLAMAQLEKVQGRRLASLRADPKWAEYQAEREAFEQSVKREQATKEDRKAKLDELISQLEELSIRPEDKRKVLEEILETVPNNRNLLVRLAFHSAMEEDWEAALEYVRTFLSTEGRQNAGRLSMRLLEPEILHCMGRQEEARDRLEAFGSRTRDPWYRTVSETLLGKRTQDSLKRESGESPEKLLTLYVALGFWAEGSGDKARALEHYKEALASFMDTWVEFDFAKERIKRLRQPSE